MAHPFNATNAVDTCKWCGRKLRRQCWTTWDRSGDRKKVVHRTYRYDKPGDYGDGHFCGLRCGWSFAVSAANSGVTLKPKR